MSRMKALKYTCVIVVGLFYAWLIIKAGPIAAVAMFLKVLGFVLFGMAHIWILDLATAARRIKWFFTSLLGYFRRLRSSSC